MAKKTSSVLVKSGENVFRVKSDFTLSRSELRGKNNLCSVRFTTYTPFPFGVGAEVLFEGKYANGDLRVSICGCVESVYSHGPIEYSNGTVEDKFWVVRIEYELYADIYKCRLIYPDKSDRFHGCFTSQKEIDRVCASIESNGYSRAKTVDGPYGTEIYEYVPGTIVGDKDSVLVERIPKFDRSVYEKVKGLNSPLLKTGDGWAYVVHLPNQNLDRFVTFSL